jgi:hypothetical protein
MRVMQILMAPGSIHFELCQLKDDVANFTRIKISVSSRGVGSLKEGERR